MKNKSVVFIAGVAGFNRGDDAIAETLIDVLLKDNRYDFAYVSVIRSGVLLNRANVSEVFINRKSIKSHVRLIKVIWSSDLIVLGGGSIIQDNIMVGFLRGIMAYPLEVVLLSKLFNKKVITAPIGVDDLITCKGKFIAKVILNLVSKVFVRDHRSHLNALNLISDKSKVVLSADPVFLYKNTTAQPSNTLVVSPALEGANDEFIVEVHRQVIESYLQQSEFNRCIILAMDERVHEDSGKIVNIYNSISSEYLDRLEMSVPKDHTEASSLIRNSNCLFSMRLHSVILGCGYVPIFCLSRGTKTNAICKELKIPFVDIKNLSSELIVNEFKRFTESVLNNKQELSSHLSLTKRMKQAMSDRFKLFEESIKEIAN